MAVIRSCIALMSVGVLAVGCSSANGNEAAPAPEAQAAAPAGHPCGLLTAADVQNVFPKAGPGKVESRLEQYGMFTCVWDHPGGTFTAQMQKDATAAPGDEIRSRASGFIDPTKPAARSNVRYETLAGVGDSAVAAVERADTQTGIVTSFALLVVRRGGRQVVFQSTQLADRDRGVALKALEELGKAAAGRL
jgi:hypothetical protein